MFELVPTRQHVRNQRRSDENTSIIPMRQFCACGPAPAAAAEGCDRTVDSLPPQIESTQGWRWPLERRTDHPVLVTQIQAEVIALPGVVFQRSREGRRQAPLLGIPAHQRRDVHRRAIQVEVFGVDRLVENTSEIDKSDSHLLLPHPFRSWARKTTSNLPSSCAVS